MEEEDILSVKEDLQKFVKKFGPCELSNLATRPYIEAFNPQSSMFSEETLLRFLQCKEINDTSREYLLQILADKTCQDLGCPSTQVKISPSLTDFSLYHNAGSGFIEFPSNVTDLTEVLHEMNRSLHLHYTNSLVAKFFTDYDSIPAKDKSLVAAFMMDSISQETDCGTPEKEKMARVGLHLMCAEKFAIDNTIRQMKLADIFKYGDKTQIKEADYDFCGFVDNKLYRVCRDLQNSRADVFNSGFPHFFNQDGSPRIKNTYSVLGDIIDETYCDCLDQFQLNYRARTFDDFVDHLERVYNPTPVYNPENLTCPEECASVLDMMRAADVEYQSPYHSFDENEYKYD